MALPLGTATRGRYTPLNADSTKNPERLLALRGQKGATWFVNSGVSASGNGLSWADAFETLAEAVAKALAGDLILLAEGHSESLSTAVTMAVAGVHVVGLGVGDRRPVLTFTADVDINLDAAGIVLENLVLKNDYDGQTIVVDINAADCAVRYCELREGSSKQWVTGIDVNGGSSNACDGTQIIGNAIYSISAGASNAIGLDAVADAVVIAGNLIDGDFGDGGIHNPTGNVLTNLLLQDNIIRNRQTGDHAIELVSACTGWAVNNTLAGDTFGTVFDPGALFCAGNTESNTAEDPGQPSPVSSGSRFPLVKYVGIHRASAYTGATPDTHGDHDGTADPYTIFTVTGDVIIWAFWGICNTTVASASDTGTIEVGVAGNTAKLIAQTTAGSGTIADGDVLVDTGAEAGIDILATSGAPLMINDGVDIIETLATNNFNSGQIDWYCVWSPAEPGASVVSA